MGGISEHVFFLSRELRKRGHDVEILTSRIPGYSPKERGTIRVGRGVAFPINKSFSRMTVGIGVSSRINRLLRKNRYDVVHIHGSLAPLLPMAVLRLTRPLPQTKTVATFHAGHGPSLLYRIFKHPMYRRYFSCYDGLIAVSPVAENTMAYFFPGNYRIVPNGVDTEVFSPGKSLLKLPDSPLKLLFVGRFEPKKGLRHLLCAMPRIKRHVPDVKLVVVAGGPMKPYYDKFLTDEVRDSVIFAGEVVGNLRREYYRWCDISITPSIGSESFGITLLEAMGCGKPVVATDIPAFRYVMSEDEGVFTRTCDHEDLARAVLELNDRKADWDKIGRAGRTKALSLSWPKVAGIIEDFFLEIRGRCGSRN